MSNRKWCGYFWWRTIGNGKALITRSGNYIYIKTHNKRIGLYLTWFRGFKEHCLGVFTKKVKLSHD